MPYTSSRLSSLLIGTPAASAASFIQLDRQLRQNPARFIRSIFWTSVRERRCSTRRRNAAASSSVLVLSSIAMTALQLFWAGYRLLGGTCHRFCHIEAQRELGWRNFGGSLPENADSGVDSSRRVTRNRQRIDIASLNDPNRFPSPHLP